MTSRKITKLYYEVITMLLPYESTEVIGSIKENILSLICEIYDANEQKNDCLLEIESAEIIRVCSDGLLLENANKHSPNVAFDMKMDALTANRINAQKQFDIDLFKCSLEEAAFVGKKSACRLLAFLNWIGVDSFQDKGKAEKIFKELALNGDDLSLNALIYVYEKTGCEEEKQRWTRIRDMIYSSMENFVPIVKKADDIDEEEFWLANIILVLKRLNFKKERCLVDRSMLYYLMNSNDAYITKLQTLCGDKTFYPIILKEEKLGEKQYGF